jgi:hypothetical protein
VLDKSLTKPAGPLGTKCSEGPAVSRQRMQEADIVYEDGQPKLANQRLIISSADLPFRCTLETQNFRPPDEKELIFSAYGYQGTDVCGVDVLTKKLVNYSNAPGQYDEPEGIYPDGRFTLVECDKQNGQGSGHVDLWKLNLDGSGQSDRLTHFSDYPGHKASNPAVSDDAQFIAFQMAKAREAAGVGHGIFVFDAARAGQHARTGGGAAYHLVPDFPRLPAGWSLGAVSGLATDSTGNVLNGKRVQKFVGNY